MSFYGLGFGLSFPKLSAGEEVKCPMWFFNLWLKFDFRHSIVHIYRAVFKWVSIYLIGLIGLDFVLEFLDCRFTVLDGGLMLN